MYTALLRHPARRILLALLVAACLMVAWLAAAAAPAQAHTTGPQLVSSIEGTAPPTPGVGIKILSTGSAPYVTISVAGGHTFEVFGLQGEHFLRVAPDGVSLNGKSPSLYLTSDPSKKPATLPATVDPVPDWQHVADQPTYSYYETRAEWPHTGQPEEARALGRQAIVYRFAIPAAYDGTTVQIEGHVTWIPAPLNLEIPLLFVPIFVVGMLWIEPKARPHLRSIARGVAVVTALAAATDGVRMLAALRAGGGGVSGLAPLAVLPGLVLLSATALPRLRRAERSAFLAVAVLGLYLAIFALLRVPVPASSAGLATWLRRLELLEGTVLVLGAGLLLFLSSPMRQSPRRERPAGTHSGRPAFGS